MYITPSYNHNLVLKKAVTSLTDGKTLCFTLSLIPRGRASKGESWTTEAIKYQTYSLKNTEIPKTCKYSVYVNIPMGQS